MTAGIRKGLFWVAIAALVGVGVGVATRAFAVHPVRVTSGSMVPTAKVGDWLVASDLDAQGRESVGRRDIVLFRFPLGTTGRAVKRVIAVGGDTVAYTDRYVSVNGRRSPIAGSPADLGPDGKPTGNISPSVSSTSPRATCSCSVTIRPSRSIAVLSGQFPKPNSSDASSS